MWDTKLKVTNEKTRKQTNKNSDSDHSMVVTRGKSGEKVVKSEVSRRYGHRRRYGFGRWAHNSMYR